MFGVKLTPDLFPPGLGPACSGSGFTRNILSLVYDVSQVSMQAIRGLSVALGSDNDKLEEI